MSIHLSYIPPLLPPAVTLLFQADDAAQRTTTSAMIAIARGLLRLIDDFAYSAVRAERAHTRTAISRASRIKAVDPINRDPAAGTILVAEADFSRRAARLPPETAALQAEESSYRARFMRLRDPPLSGSSRTRYRIEHCRVRTRRRRLATRGCAFRGWKSSPAPEHPRPLRRRAFQTTA